jgi:uncharacterized membrane protein
MIKRTGWWLMTGLAVAIALYAVVLLFVPTARPPFMNGHAMPLAVLAHFGCSAVALAFGPFQFRADLRARRLQLHRWMGRTYVVAVLAGGSAGLALATVAQGGLVAQTGFATLALAWLGTTTLAYLTIRRGDDVQHRAWMTRSFALTYAAVTLRIYLPLSIASGVPFDDAYRVIAWMCWVPNLLVAERLFVPTVVRRPVVQAL